MYDQFSRMASLYPLPDAYEGATRPSPGSANGLLVLLTELRVARRCHRLPLFMVGHHTDGDSLTDDPGPCGPARVPAYLSFVRCRRRNVDETARKLRPV